jgi:hypothetical protein
MVKAALWIAAVVLALVLLASLVGLYSLRRRTNRPWSNQDYFAALGILVALLGMVVSILLARGRDDPTEPADVVAYRQAVRTTCDSLAALRSTDPFAAAMAAGGDRNVLDKGLRSQLDASTAILDELWKQTVPGQLASDARDARGATDELTALSQTKVEQLPNELPPPIHVRATRGVQHDVRTARCRGCPRRVDHVAPRGPNLSGADDDLMTLGIEDQSPRRCAVVRADASRFPRSLLRRPGTSH